MDIPFYHIDAFTTQPFAGNPAAVCVLDSFFDDSVLQSIATENNLAETVFVVAQTEQATDSDLHDNTSAHAHYAIRWFTPRCEVELCGHATLAAAYALWIGAHCTTDCIHFSSASGILRASRASRNSTTHPHDPSTSIALDFPRIECSVTMTPEHLAEAIGTMPFAVSKAGPDLLVEVGDADCVRHADIDMPALAGIETERGIIICAPHDDPDCDIICRFFAPRAGIPEDHVTGSAHCALGTYWSKRLKKNTLRSYQASPRGGYIDMDILDNRIILHGSACCLITGSYHLPNA